MIRIIKDVCLLAQGTSFGSAWLNLVEFSPIRPGSLVDNPSAQANDPVDIFVANILDCFTEIDDYIAIDLCRCYFKEEREDRLAISLCLLLLGNLRRLVREH